MHIDFREVNALYHFGIKGMKWGVRNETDSSEDRIAFEKSRADYYKSATKDIAKMKTAQSSNRKSVILGRQEVEKAFLETEAMKQQSRDERKAKEKKYKIVGSTIIGSILLAGSLAPGIINSSKRIASKRTKK